jgi:hypothetical protein
MRIDDYLNTIMTTPRQGDSNTSVHGADPVMNYLGLISTKPRRLTQEEQDEQDRLDEIGTPEGNTRAIEQLASEEARNAAAYVNRRRYWRQPGDPNTSALKPIPPPKTPIDPKWWEAPASENIRDDRQIYRNTFMNYPMYEYFNQKGTPPATQAEDPSGSMEDLRAKALEQMARTMSGLPNGVPLNPGQLEIDAGISDVTWPNAYKQMAYEGRAPAYPPREKPLTDEQFDEMMRDNETPGAWPKPAPTEVDG